MTLHTPDEVPDCVKSSVFTEVELAHDWTRPASAGGLLGHPPVDLRVLLVRRQPQRGVRRKRPAPRLPDLPRWDAGLLAV